MDDFWQIVTSAEWAANEGVPLAGTFIAVSVALLGIRWQLKHDRELVQATRRREAALEFANTAMQIYDELMEKEPANTWWQSPKRPETGRIYRAYDEASILIPESKILSDIQSGLRDYSWAWQACHIRCRELGANGTIMTDLQFGTSMTAGVEQLLHPVELACDELKKWDGHLPTPAFTWPHNHIPLSRSQIKRRRAWLGRWAALCDEHMQRRTGTARP